jgi:hypothetical protein
MDRAIITFHLPTHREVALKMQIDKREAELAYDRAIGDYMRFLEEEGRKAGFRIQTDQRDFGPVYGIEGRDHDEEKAAHDWLDSQPDIWNWLPSSP